MKLRIITPKKVTVEKEGVTSLTAPGTEGEFTVLPNHVPLFTMLKQGIVRVESDEDEILYSIGGGYLETDGKELNVLVSRAYGQDEIDEAEVAAAREKAEKLVEEAETEEERHAAMMTLRRSIIDMKIIKRRTRRRDVRNRQ